MTRPESLTRRHDESPALYGRYSTDKQREASIDDQFRNCENHAKREGWKIVHRYADEAITGSTKDRPQYQAMLAAAEARQFDVLIVDDLSRLTRDDIETKQTLRRLKYWGIRLIGVSDGFDSDSKGHKIQASVRGMMNEIYIDDLREKTDRGMTGQVLQGNNAGGRCYGYRHIPIEDASRHDEYGRPAIVAVRREIDPQQAGWVRKIFRWYAEGYTPRWIAAELNRLGVPSPGATWKRRAAGTWAASALYGNGKFDGVLNNSLYAGRYVWNRTRYVTDPVTGKQKRVARPESEWIERDMPELPIVPQALWEAVKARRSVGKRNDEKRSELHINARTGAGPKYLLSGLLKCGVCGGNWLIAFAMAALGTRTGVRPSAPTT